MLLLNAIYNILSHLLMYWVLGQTIKVDWTDIIFILHIRKLRLRYLHDFPRAFYWLTIWKPHLGHKIFRRKSTRICIDSSFTNLWIGCSSSMPGWHHGQALDCTTWPLVKSFIWWSSSNISTLLSCQCKEGSKVARHFCWLLEMSLEIDTPLLSPLFHWSVHITLTSPTPMGWGYILLPGQMSKGEWVLLNPNPL